MADKPLLPALAPTEVPQWDRLSLHAVGAQLLTGKILIIALCVLAIEHVTAAAWMWIATVPISIYGCMARARRLGRPWWWALAFGLLSPVGQWLLGRTDRRLRVARVEPPVRFPLSVPDQSPRRAA